MSEINKNDEKKHALQKLENVFDKATEEVYYEKIKRAYPNIDLNKALRININKQIFYLFIMIIFGISIILNTIILLSFPENISLFNKYFCLIGIFCPIILMMILQFLHLKEKLFVTTF